MLAIVACFLAACLSCEVAWAAEQIDTAFLAKEWERKFATIEALHVIWLTYISKSDALANDSESKSGASLKEPTRDAPPIDPNVNKQTFMLWFYDRVGAKEQVELYQFDQNALIGQTRFGPTADTVKPQLPFIVGDFPTRQVYDALRDRHATVSLTREPTGITPKVCVTVLWSPVQGKTPSARITALLDPALGYAPLECKVSVLVGESSRLTEMHRWSRHVQVLKDLWLPQEHEINIFSPGGKVMLRNKNIILRCVVNCRVPDSVFE